MAKVNSKERRYAALKREFDEFIRGIYRDNARIPVFGEGNLSARVMLVGEAPGEKETLHGQPFVGKAGRNLDEFLSHLPLTRGDLYITNTVKFRPQRLSAKTGRYVNRPPDREETALCLPFLHREIALIDPALIVTLGNVPLRALTASPGLSIGAAHGRVIEVLGADGRPRSVYALYHPAAVIYNRSLAQVYAADMRALAQLIARL